MKPPSFEYHDPTTLDEALALLDELGDQAKVLAGGQSLVPLLNFRLARPAHLVDINRIAELAYIRAWHGGVAIGAMTRQWHAERNGQVAERAPLLRQAIQHIGHIQIRNRGTVGGSLAHADPAAELSGVVAALDGQLVVRSRAGERVLRPEEFFLTYLTTSIEPTELLVEVRVPALPVRSGTAFVELSRRHGDFALVGVAATLSVDTDDRCSEARIALVGVGPVPMRGRAGEAALIGKRPSPERLREAARLATGDLEPDSDLQASGEYRKDMAEVLVRRALEQAHRNLGVVSRDN
jgi:CO/xanthine dehydrogenase FAD-binding subunit